MFASSKFGSSNVNIKPFLPAEHTQTTQILSCSNTQHYNSLFLLALPLHFLPPSCVSYPQYLARGLAHSRHSKESASERMNPNVLGQMHKMVITPSHLNKWTSVNPSSKNNFYVETKDKTLSW